MRNQMGGMKIEIEIPEWATNANQHLKILSNQELVAFKEPGGDWEIKKTRCVQCGECCMDVFNLTPFGGDDEGKCNALVKEGDRWLCTAGADKPFRCLQDPLKANNPDCPIEYL
jgi:hypothetical protein